MTVAAKAVIGAHYSSAPRVSYFNGCSQGGRQAITSAQRYPADFDGIVAGAAAWDTMRLHAARLELNRVMNRSSESAIPPSKYPLVHQAVLQACDALDGVKDDVLENPLACRVEFRTLQCNGDDSASCLTAPQVHSASAMLAHLMPGAELRWDVLGAPQPLGNAVTGMKNVKLADGAPLESSDPNLAPFFARGGKLLMWHGWADPQVTPQLSVSYYKDVVKTVGAQADDSIALFMMPGVYHCQGGPGPDRFDRMAPLEAWVERGIKPASIVAAHVTDGKVDRTRPLCPFPQVARWTGSGSTDDAANFVCAAP
jgi:feruloyl esterase